MESAVLKWWPVIAAVLVGAVAYGSLRTDVSNLKERVRQLEAKPTAQAQAIVNSDSTHKISKCDLCIQLVEALSRTSKAEKQRMLSEQMQKMDCYEGVAASASLMNTADPADTAAVVNAIQAVGNTSKN